MSNQLEEDDQIPQKGLYVPELESDACGTGFIANLNGIKSHDVVENALKMLGNMEHRGACGCEPNSGDGAGIMLQTPHDFFVKKAKERGFELPEFGQYGVGVVFYPTDRNLQNQCRTLLFDYADEMGFDVLGYRKVPVDNELLGDTAVSVEPRVEHIFVKPRQTPPDRYWLERRLYVLRKWATHQIHTTFPQTADTFYMPSFSYKTVVYKGQLTTWQLRAFFPDLHDIDFKSAIALVHSRFSTNTVPKWKLAQPFRYIAHNGEINTITGNVNWWKSKELMMESPVFSKDELQKLFPVCGTGLSDSANFDNVLEFMVLNGRSLPHALMMMVPEAWQHDEQMEEYKKSFYEYHENMMEPWDGPAAVCFTDGIVVGATLDRNGLRPLRYVLTDDNVLIAASEAGVLDIPQEKVVLKGRLQPGKMLIADLDEHRIIGDEELKNVICKNRDYKTWVEGGKILLQNLKNTEGVTEAAILADDSRSLLEKQQLFGFTKEDIKMLIEPMAKNGEEPIGSMGADTPLAVLSHRAQHLSSYFKQLFAQVTNPPIDPIRERAVMSLHVKLGLGENILIPTEKAAHFISLEQPILKNTEIELLKNIKHPKFKSEVIDITFDAEGDKGKLEAAINTVCAAAESAVRRGANILILSDRETDILNAPMPSLLAAGAVHHHLVRIGLRSKASLVVEAGDIWEVHHFATLVGFGIQAINPYLAYATIKNAVDTEGGKFEYYIDKYIKACGKSMLKIMSKIGISTIQSYAGAQIFEILGLDVEVVDKCFHKAVSRIKGLSFDGIAEEVLAKHRLAFIETPLGLTKNLEAGGVYQWKRQGEAHMFNPQTIHLLQLSTRTNDYGIFKKYSSISKKFKPLH
jgi:glutamate synthase (NADPH) large chain